MSNELPGFNDISCNQVDKLFITDKYRGTVGRKPPSESNQDKSGPDYGSNDRKR